MSNETSPRVHWGTHFGFVLAAAGSAIGLGNIWKFPYITGEYGGGAFVLVYLLCILLVGIPIFIAELYIGQKTQKDTVSAFIILDGKKTPWQIAGWMGVLSAFIILSFYSVVGGWILDYLWGALRALMSTAKAVSSGDRFNNLIGNWQQVVFWHSVFMILTALIVSRGIKGGIERASKIMMPALFVILVVLLLWSFSLPGWQKSLEFLFKPDFSKLNISAVLVALGHSFFTLSLGMGAMITYGSYLGEDENLIKTGIIVSIADTAIALLAGMVIFSIVFSFDKEAAGGPGLMFVTLPDLFLQMSMGPFVAVLFFLFVAFAALSSAISLLEVVVTYFVDELGWHRQGVTFLMSFVIWALGLLSALSFSVLADVKILGGSIFDFFDNLSSSFLLPLGGLLISLFFGWILGMKAIDEVFKGRGTPILRYGLWFAVAVIAPLCVTWVFVSKLYDWLG